MEALSKAVGGSLRTLKYIPFIRHNRALSYTISAILITSTTVVLVLAAFLYAYQVLNRQRGASEFEVIQKSFLSFDDALESVAWKPGASRFTRFTAEYGYLELIPSLNGISINATVNGQSKPLSNATFPGMTGAIKYWLDTSYVSYELGYQSYIIGNNSSVVGGSTDSYGRGVINQQPSWISVTLDYRVRAMRTSVLNVSGVKTNYVDIWVIKLKMLVTSAWSYIHDFDLTARCVSVKTVSYQYDVSTANSLVSVRIGSSPASQISIPLDVPGRVVFNVVLAEVQVNV